VRSEIISVRFELADLALARAAALTLGLDFSTFLRMAAMRAVTQLGPRSRGPRKTTGKRK